MLVAASSLAPAPVVFLTVAGQSEERRALQLGLRDEALTRFGKEQLLEVLDLSEFVAEQRALLQADRLPDLITPRERVYRPADPAVATRLRLDQALRP